MLIQKNNNLIDNLRSIEQENSELVNKIKNENFESQLIKDYLLEFTEKSSETERTKNSLVDYEKFVSLIGNELN